jgi:hypothetical protein
MDFAEVIEAARLGECWLCGRRGFQKLSQHLAMTHDMRADAVRERYGLSWTQPLATDAYRERARAALTSRPNFLQAAQSLRGRPRRPPRSRKQAQSRAAMAEVSNRPEVKAQLADRNRDPSFNAKRAAGLRASAKAAAQRAAARANRWPQ